MTTVTGTLRQTVDLDIPDGAFAAVDTQARGDIVILKAAIAQDVLDDAALATRIAELERRQNEDDAQEAEAQAKSDEIQAELDALVQAEAADDAFDVTIDSRVKDLANRVLAVETRPSNPAPSTNDISLSDMPGPTDNDRLTQALAAQKQDRRRVIRLDWRDNGRRFTRTNNYDPSCPPRIVGPAVGWQNPEQNAPQMVDVTVDVGEGTASWFVGSGITFNMLVKGFTVRSTNGISQIFHHPYGSGWTCYAGHFADLTLYGVKHGWGKPNDAFSMTLTKGTGEIQFPGLKDTAYSFRGADSWWDAHTNLDGLLGGGKYLVRLENWSKSHLKNQYLTARDFTRAILNSAPNSGQGGTYVSECVIEGHNAGDPAHGALIVNQSGMLFLSNSPVNFGMSGESATDATIDTALVRVISGQVSVRDISNAKATVTPATVPFAHVSDGTLLIEAVLTGYGQPLPKVRQTGTGKVNPVSYELVTT